MRLDAQQLKMRHRQLRDLQDPAMATRLHRALSWLVRAERERDDQDACFLFLWVAFNSAYAGPFSEEARELARARDFIDRLVALDDTRQLHTILFDRFSGPVRNLLNNKFVYAPFWRAMAEHDPSQRWKVSFEESKQLAMRAVMENATATCLMLVLERLYVLRNQLVHGGATWNSSANRDQLRDGVHLLSALVPQMLALMMDADTQQQEAFGPVAYPLLPDYVLDVE